MNKEKQLAKNTLLYSIGNFGSKILSFLVVPLYTHYIDTSDMGIYDAVITAVSLLAPILVLSIYEGIYRWVIQDINIGGKYIRYGLRFEARSLLIAMCLYILVGQVINIPYFWIILIYTILICLHTYFQRVTRALGNVSLFTKMGLIYTVIYLIFNILFVVILKIGVVSLFLSSIIGNAVVCLIMFVVQYDAIVHSAYKQRVEKSERRAIIKFSSAITPNDICWWIVGLSDRFALIWFVSASANGIYAISQKFPTIITMLTSIFYMAWQDQSIANFKNRYEDDYYEKIFRVYSRLLFCACLCLIPVSKYVILVLTADAYHSAWYYIAPLYIGTVYSALASFLGVGYIGSKQTSKAFSTTLVAAIMNMGINIIFMSIFPYYGIAIASISTMLSYLVLFLVRYKQTKQYFSIRVSKKEMFLFTIVNSVYAVVILKTNFVADLFLFIIALILSYVLFKDYIIKVFSFLKLKTVSKK